MEEVRLEFFEERLGGEKVDTCDDNFQECLTVREEKWAGRGFDELCSLSPQLSFLPCCRIYSLSPPLTQIMIHPPRYLFF